MDELSFPKSKIKVVLLENIHPKAIQIFQDEGFTNIEYLKASLKLPEIYEHVHNAHILGIRSGTHIDKEILNHCSKLLAIGCYCIGTDQVDLHEAMLHGIPVFNDPHSNTRSVAEMIIGLCIVLLRDLFNKNIAAHGGKWKKVSEGVHEMRGKILGIVGYGHIGSQVSILAESMGMQVFYYDIEPKQSIGNAKRLSTLEELLAISDIVTLHIPETPATQNIMNQDRLKRMKKSAYLINTSRGNILDVEALAAMLRDKSIRGAAIDVFPNEPLNNAVSFKSPLQNLDNVILTPHIGGATEEAQESIALSVSQKLIYFINRGSSEGATNFPGLSLLPNENTHRILHVHQNIPGMLSQINKIFADRGINILAQYLKTTHEIGYVVFDIEKQYTNHLIEVLKSIPGTIRARILY